MRIQKLTASIKHLEWMSHQAQRLLNLTTEDWNIQTPTMMPTHFSLLYAPLCHRHHDHFIRYLKKLTGTTTNLQHCPLRLTEVNPIQ